MGSRSSRRNAYATSTVALSMSHTTGALLELINALHSMPMMEARRIHIYEKMT